MKNWKKDRNYRKCKRPDGTYRYIITIDGEDVDVSAEVYTAYAKSARQLEYIEYDLKCDRVLQDADGKAVRDENGLPVMLSEREVSLDKLIDEDWDFCSTSLSPEDFFFDDSDLETAALYHCLAMLSGDERKLITALFYDGIKEQEYAKTLGVKRQSINERKLRVLKKIKSILEQPC